MGGGLQQLGLRRRINMGVQLRAIGFGFFAAYAGCDGYGCIGEKF
jgi:hypothetical protein